MRIAWPSSSRPGSSRRGHGLRPANRRSRQAVRRHLDPDRSGRGLPGNRPQAGPADLRGLDLGQDAQGRPPALGPVREAGGSVKEYWALVDSPAGGRRAIEPPRSEDAPARRRPWRRDLVRLADADRPRRAWRVSSPPETPGARQAMTRVRRESAGTLPAEVALAPPLAGDRPDPSAPGPGSRAGHADPGRLRVRLKGTVRAAARHRAACPVAPGPAPDPPDADDAGRADPAPGRLRHPLEDE